MLVEERLVNEVVQAIQDLPAVIDDTSDVSWFAARQPGIVRYLADRCGDDSDALAVALHYACAIEKAFRSARDALPPRVPSSLLGGAEAAFLEESSTRVRPGQGLADRQPALCRLIHEVVDNPPLLLSEFEATRVGVSLAAVVYALDEVA
jgi:hypothetical protein